MTAWDELMAATRPGTELSLPDGDWWVFSRALRRNEEVLAVADRMTIEVELIRSGSSYDPRQLPPDVPRPTTPEEARNGG